MTDITEQVYQAIKELTDPYLLSSLKHRLNAYQNLIIYAQFFITNLAVFIIFAHFAITLNCA